MRQLAGLMLKNNIKERWHTLSPDVQQYVRENLLGSLGDPQKYIRTTVGSCITTVIYAGGLEACWGTRGHCEQEFLSWVDEAHELAVEAAFLLLTAH